MSHLLQTRKYANNLGLSCAKLRTSLADFIRISDDDEVNFSNNNRLEYNIGKRVNVYITYSYVIYTLTIRSNI